MTYKETFQKILFSAPSTFDKKVDHQDIIADSESAHRDESIDK
jgi:hypothetical protein